MALFVALGGSVYAAAKIDGRQIRPASLPGNRVVPGSLPGERVRIGSLPANRLAPGSIAAAQLDFSGLGPVPEAVHADTAREAGTALNAANAENAERLNGYSAGCAAGTRSFAGACWQKAHSETALTAPLAAATCASLGGELPAALMLAAFAEQTGTPLAIGDEWSGDLTNVSGPGIYAVVTVGGEGIVDSSLPGETKKFRCVIPLLG